MAASAIASGHVLRAARGGSSASPRSRWLELRSSVSGIAQSSEQLWANCGANLSWTVDGGSARGRWLWTTSCSSAPQDRAPPGNGRLPPPLSRRSGSSSSSPRSRLPPGGDRMERFFATCAPGLEEIVFAELCSPMIGARSVQIGSAGVAFCGTMATGVRANLWSRSAIRILVELATGPLPRRRRADPVYEFVRDAADWPTLLVDESSDSPSSPPQALSRKRGLVPKFRTFSVNSRVYDCEGVSNSMFASTRAKDAICDAVKDACGGSRPDPPADGVASADVPLFFSLYRDRGILYRDMSGVSLHKRGYRDVMHRAGLNEAIAAAMLTIAGWNSHLPGFGLANRNAGSNSKVLLDPMCGSGTLLIEAALMAINSAPGLMRNLWPFETWHDFDPSILEACRQEAIAAEVRAPEGLRLLGNDIHEGALSLCERDAKAANVLSMLELSCKDCKDYSPRLSPSLVVVNPPWGARLEPNSGGDDDTLLTTWRNLGRFLKSSCNETDVYVLSGNSNVTHAMHMKADKRWAVTVGGVDCRIMHYYVLPPKARPAAETISEAAAHTTG
ncbi:hypothetical protein AXG93_1335s1140 [Marchantia polymorpha subsp. ruderalis]|uniref:Uncharacterized protein n=1 Tax=Marchantia polymorpha subsp. ruderalis TaxID=1480154 RepID=A0A176W828_MARPO|nr:hypothetical protein AXG93_1335s1140 [Marchantia polymorpha subsp. ruderalis]